MAADCIPCGTGFPVEYLEILNCKERLNKRNGGIQQLAFINCNSTISTLATASVWDTLKTTPGALIRTPQGLGSWGKPNTTTVKTGCKRETVTEKTQTLSFKTFDYDNETFIDADFMCKLNDSFSSYRLIWLGCDGNLYFSNEYAAGGNPGFPMILLNNWDDSPETGLMSRQFEITMDWLDVCYSIIKPSAALVTAIFGGTSNTSGGSGA